MRPTSSKNLNTVLYILLGLGALYVTVRWLLPWLLPFLIAFGCAALIEPAVTYLSRRGVKRGLAAGICVLIFLAALLSILWLFLSRIVQELSELGARLPEILTSVTVTLQRWETALTGLMKRAPEGLSKWLDKAAAGVTESLARLPAQLTAKLFSFLSGFAAATPAILLFTVTLLIGFYFISASYPDLLHAAARLLPEKFLYRARMLRMDLRRTLGRWLRAQLIMMLITFGELTAAFLLLRIRYALLLALLTAVIDALPVLGAGTVLVPWAVYDFMTGNVPQGVGLAITYAAVAVLRSCIQAKLLGDQLGLHPLATLAAIYVGFKVWGVWGMIVFPILAISLKQALPGFSRNRRTYS